jgi:hypothetical protein
MRSKSLNVTATSLISYFFFRENTGASMKREKKRKKERERKSGTRKDREREERKEIKNRIFFRNSNRN